MGFLSKDNIELELVITHLGCKSVYDYTLGDEDHLSHSQIFLKMLVMLAILM